MVALGVKGLWWKGEVKMDLNSRDGDSRGWSGLKE